MKKEAPNKFCKHFEKKTEYSAESSDIRAEEKRRIKIALERSTYLEKETGA
jgi:hypothetical protein